MIHVINKLIKTVIITLSIQTDVTSILDHILSNLSLLLIFNRTLVIIFFVCSISGFVVRSEVMPGQKVLSSVSRAWNVII